MKILIAGIGSIGSNLVNRLVADTKNKHHITVLDKDLVEERNVVAGTQFYTENQIGTPKVEALQLNIYKWYGGEIDIDYTNLIGSCRNLFHRFDLVIDCFDNHDSRMALQTSFSMEDPKIIDCKLLHIGFSDQFTFAIEWAENYKVPDDIQSGMDICTMEGASSFVNKVASLGSLVVQEFITNKKKVEIVGNKLSNTIL